MQLRRRRAREMAEAFHRECERSSQEAADLAPSGEKLKHQLDPGVACVDETQHICEDSEESSVLVSYEASVVSCASQTASAEGIFHADSSTVHSQSLDKRRWSGLSLPRLCREKNAAEACKKLGFVVTRSRTLSLDDCSSHISLSLLHPKHNFSGTTMKLGSSRDDSCLPLVSDCSIAQLKKELVLAATTTSPSLPICVSKKLEDKARSFSSRRKDGECLQLYDLVCSPGPKFLLRFASQDSENLEDDSSSPFKANVAVPFKWEEAPGKPKPEAAVQKPDPSLQLPPRLLVRSFTLNKQDATRKYGARRAQSVNHRRGMLLADKMDPSSPTSILCGPDQSSTSCSSSESLDRSCNVESEAVVTSDAESRTVIFSVQQQQQPGSIETSAPLGEDIFKSSRKQSLAKSIAKVLHPEWLRKRRRNKFRGSHEVEMWAPTLAAYFHSMESSDISKKSDSISLPDSGLLEHALFEDPEQQDITSKSGPLEYNQRSSENGFKSDDGFGEFGGGGITDENSRAYCGCASPRLAPFSPSSKMRLFRTGSGRQKWMVKRIRRSSRLFQMFVFKAVKHAVQPRRKSPLDSSKLLYCTIPSRYDTKGDQS